MINPITNLEINKEINHIFDTIKSNIVLKASVNSYRLMNHILSVKMQITIDDFRKYLSNEHKSYTRQLWYEFIPYIKKIIDYGYHFKNIEQINRFVDIPDNIIEFVAKEKSYNITSSAEVVNFEEAEDKNLVYFSLIAEAFEKDEDPDADVKVRSLPQQTIEKTDEEKHQDLLDKINKMSDSDEEELEKQLKQFNSDGINHANIVTKVNEEKINKMSTVEFCRNLKFIPKATKHELNGNILSIKFALTKKVFESALINFDKSIDDIWPQFVKDFIVNPSKYTNFDKDMSCIAYYTLQNNFVLKSKDIKIHDPLLDNNKQVLRFYADVIV